ncbi:MAG TPA: hypothetical protein P5572_05715 [Phycisphaerae bacterium]|nr:hypothetical protein [Phycisphaerales bacterium]HRX84499.1 hypothetical protein [Phycisphaerae bacterium]
MRTTSITMVAACFAAMFVLASCKQEEPPAPPTPSTAPLASAPKSTPPASNMGELPPGHPPIGGQDMGDAQAGNAHSGMNVLPKSGERKMLDTAPTQFEGLTLTPPDGWKPFDASGGMMAPVAAFLLPPADGATGDTEARLTYFPNMHGMPAQMNLDRWFGQVQQPDGKATKDVAKVEEFDAGGAKITVADMTGTIGGQTDQRMIAAIIEHPKGPHFLKVAGPAATVAKWHDSVIDYLKSAKVTE